MEFSLGYFPEGRLRLITKDRCWLQVRPAWASPIKHPGRFLSLMDGKDREIVMLPEGLKGLPENERAILETELRRRYLTSQIIKIHDARTVFASAYWTVETDRGPREFVTQSMHENAQWHAPTHLVLVDVDGNRYEVRDVNALDDESKANLLKMV